MTPFDPTALLVMLVTFYPAVSPAALARAFLERPDYFAGGTLGGSHGDKLTLPDGRCFDLIFNVDDPTQASHWQVIVCGGGNGGGDPTFPLEPGPLTPIAASSWPPRLPDDVFVPLVGAAYAALGGSEQGLTLIESDFGAAITPGAFDGAVGPPLDGASGTVVGLDWMLNGIDPSDVIGATAAQAGAIDGHEAPYDEGVPGDMPGVPGPGGPPDESHDPINQMAERIDSLEEWRESIDQT